MSCNIVYHPRSSDDLDELLSKYKKFVFFKNTTKLPIVSTFTDFLGDMSDVAFVMIDVKNSENTFINFKRVYTINRSVVCMILNTNTDGKRISSILIDCNLDVIKHRFLNSHRLFDKTE